MNILKKFWVPVNSGTYLFLVVFIPPREAKLNPLINLIFNKEIPGVTKWNI